MKEGVFFLMPKPNHNVRVSKDNNEFQGFSSEKVLLDTKPNFWLYSNNFILKIVVLFLLIFMFSPIMAFIYRMQSEIVSRFNLNIGSIMFYTELILILCIVIVIIKIVLDILDWYYTRYVLTDHRIVIERGLIRREKVSMPYAKVQDIEITQSILERIMGVGDVIIYGANELSETILDDIPHPKDVEEILLTNINRGIANQNNYQNNTQPTENMNQNMYQQRYPENNVRVDYNDNEPQYQQNIINNQKYPPQNNQYDEEVSNTEVHYFNNEDDETITPEHAETKQEWDKNQPYKKQEWNKGQPYQKQEWNKGQPYKKQEWDKEEVFRKHDELFKRRRK